LPLSECYKNNLYHLGICAFAKTPINELFTKQHIDQNVKEYLNLFNNNQL